MYVYIHVRIYTLVSTGKYLISYHVRELPVSDRYYPHLSIQSNDHACTTVKGIVHFEIKIWYLSAYPKDIQVEGVFFSSVDPILICLGQTVLVCQSYNGRYRSLSL